MVTSPRAVGLTTDQKRSLHADGFVRVPGVVPDELVGRALRAINHDLGKGIDPAELRAMEAISFCPSLCRTPAITDLFERSGARAVVESATGPLKPVDYGQIAPRWPEALDGAQPPKHYSPHIDGIHAPDNGVPMGTLQNFTALACVLLSDLPTTDAGNFTVWPGSHRVLERFYREHTDAALRDYSTHPGLGTPQQITGRAGDLIICQFLLGHDVSLNVSPHIRYAVFFRVASTTLTEENRLGSVLDPWRDWNGMRAIIAR
ncbi:MAG: hypothetical protein H0V44_18230 [Planctomycetes bacterium]|nr:hypothetical protein [Planctomycetota bacterium]